MRKQEQRGAGTFLHIFVSVTGTDLPGLKVGTLNVNGLGNNVKRGEVLKWLTLKGEDIIILQETHSTTDIENRWLRELGRKVYFNNGTSNALGTAIIIINKKIKIIRHKIIVNGRLSLLEFELDGVPYCLANVYAPNTDDVEFLELLSLDIFGRDRDDFLILGGDWNTILDNHTDKIGGNQTHANKKCQAFLNTLMAEIGLHDPYRINSPTGRKYTHFNKKCKTGTRLDFFLVDSNVINLPICTSDISHGFKSDHSYVSLHLQGNKIERGKGYWKLNNSLLDNDEFCESVKNTIESTLAESFDSWGGVWDVIKFKIKDSAIRFGKIQKNVMKIAKLDLEKKIDELHKKISDSPTDKDLFLTQLHETRHQLDTLTSTEIKGIITRARLQWVEEGERSTKYFLGLEKAASKRKALTNLVTDSGDIVTSQDDISKHVVAFYKALFSSRNPNKTDIQTYLRDSNLDTIDEELKTSIDRPLSVEELTPVVESLKNNKSPGWDGLTSEFYKKFWDNIKWLIMKVIDEAYDNCILPPSMRIGVISLIPKPKPPPELRLLKNWRPITLLNTDYKIFTHAIKNRIMQAVPQLISSSQSGFQPGKSTSDNLILMYLVLEYFQNNPEEEGLLLEIDYEKAFDSVEHDYLRETLKAMGFGERLISLVKLAFNGCLSYVNVNGHLSDPIYLTRGVHQGSPLSPVLFLLIAQTFTKNLENNVNIVGITVEGVELIQSLFADDTDLFIKPSPIVLAQVFLELNRFAKVAGCKYNPSKTKCIPLGRAKFNTQLICDLRSSYGQGFVPDDGIFTALGIQFNSNEIANITSSNYETKMEKLLNIIKLWAGRSLTIYGRLTLIKAMLLSQMVYIILPLPCPSTKICSKINRTLHQFLWGTKTEKMLRKTVELPKIAGGLDMIDFDKFLLGLKMKIISKLLNDRFEHPWKNIIINQLRNPNYIRISIESGTTKNGRNFAADALECYRKWVANITESRNKTVNEIIWDNKRVSGSQNTLWNSYLISNDILYLNQLVNEDGGIYDYANILSKFNLSPELFRKTDYLPIKMTLKCYHSPTDQMRSLSNIDPNSSMLDLLKGSRSAVITSKNIRNSMIHPSEHSPKFKEKWSSVFLTINADSLIDWNKTFHYLYSTTNNFKLIQHQYKILSRIATSGYIRHKMKIAESPLCFSCGSSSHQIETLEHIYIKCTHRSELLEKVSRMIREELDPLFVLNPTLNITLLHDNVQIRRILLVFNYYIGIKYQNRDHLNWSEFEGYLRSYITS